MRGLISPSQLKILLNNGKPPLIIDVRVEEAYRQGHLPGARHIPFDKLPETTREIPFNRTVVIYCNMHIPGNSASERAAEYLQESGYHVLILDGGYPEWEAAGLPVERSGRL